jgi:hypothetical protein
MIRKFSNITSSLLLLVFLLPSIVKLEHHHKHYISETPTDNHNLAFTDKCIICSFEFSVFLPDFGYVDLLKEKPLINYYNNYDSVYHSNFSQLSFLLRAPPYRQI